MRSIACFFLQDGGGVFRFEKYDNLIPKVGGQKCGELLKLKNGLILV